MNGDTGNLIGPLVQGPVVVVASVRCSSPRSGFSIHIPRPSTFSFLPGPGVYAHAYAHAHAHTHIHL